MLEFNHVSESYVQKIIGESKVANCRTDPIPSKLMKKFKVLLHVSHYNPDKLII